MSTGCRAYVLNILNTHLAIRYPAAAVFLKCASNLAPDDIRTRKSLTHFFCLISFSAGVTKRELSSVFTISLQFMIKGDGYLRKFQQKSLISSILELYCIFLTKVPLKVVRNKNLITFSLPLDGGETLYSHRTCEYIAKAEVEIFLMVMVSMVTVCENLLKSA